MIMKLVENVCLDEISDKFENTLCQIKKLGHYVKSYKNRVYSLEATFSVW